MNNNRQKQIEKSPQWKDGKFHYPYEVPKLSYKLKDMLAFGKTMIDRTNRRFPKTNSLPIHELDVQQFERAILPVYSWFGHSTLLFKLDGKVGLIDPVFDKFVSPIPVIGKRFYEQMPIERERLPEIDFIIISHDHYDHLEKSSIQILNRKTKQFIVPLGVSAYLLKWDVPSEKIIELDWWDSVEIDSLLITATPARHESGRGLKKNQSLWNSYVLQGEQGNCYLNGDSGYGPHFKEIGERFGPFDIAFMECGQYDENFIWPYHMIPKETVQAFMDVKGQKMVPIHWGAFALNFHAWDHPVESLHEIQQTQPFELHIPQIRELVLTERTTRHKQWWKDRE